MDRMSKIHVWVGLTDSGEDEFYNYFDLSPFHESEEGDDFEICGFAKDLGKEIYNEDFIGIYFDEEDKSLGLALDELPDPELVDKLNKVCLDKDIKEANAMFYYTDARIEITDTSKKYNGLLYLGCYDWDWD